MGCSESCDERENNIHNNIHKKRQLVDLQDKLKRLQTVDSQHCNITLKGKTKELQSKIDDIYSQESKSAKVLAYKLRKQQVENTIYNIRDLKTKTIEDKIGKIQKSFKTFYQSLYTQPQAASDTEIERFLQYQPPPLSSSQNDTLVSPISHKELNLAISKLKMGKSPGSDGYTPEWYKCLKSELTPLILNTFNRILQIGEIPPSWREAFISVIP